METQLRLLIKYTRIWSLLYEEWRKGGRVCQWSLFGYLDRHIALFPHSLSLPDVHLVLSVFLSFSLPATLYPRNGWRQRRLCWFLRDGMHRGIRYIRYILNPHSPLLILFFSSLRVSLFIQTYTNVCTCLLIFVFFSCSLHHPRLFLPFPAYANSRNPSAGWIYSVLFVYFLIVHFKLFVFTWEFSSNIQ